MKSHQLCMLWTLLQLAVYVPMETDSAAISKNCKSYSGSWNRICTLLAQLRESLEGDQDSNNLLTQLEEELTADRGKYSSMLTNIHQLTTAFQTSKENEISWLNSTWTETGNTVVRLNQELEDIREFISENDDTVNQSLSFDAQCWTRVKEVESCLVLNIHEAEINKEMVHSRLNHAVDSQDLMKKKIKNTFSSNDNDEIKENFVDSSSLGISLQQIGLLQKHIHVIHRNNENLRVLMVKNYEEQIKKLSEKYNTKLDKISKYYTECKSSEIELHSKLNNAEINSNILKFKLRLMQEKLQNIESKARVDLETEPLPDIWSGTSNVQTDGDNFNGHYDALIKSIESINTTLNSASFQSQREHIYKMLISDLSEMKKQYSCSHIERNQSSTEIHCKECLHLQEKVDEIKTLILEKVTGENTDNEHKNKSEEENANLCGKSGEGAVKEKLGQNGHQECLVQLGLCEASLDNITKKFDNTERACAKPVIVKTSQVAEQLVNGSTLVISCEVEGLPTPEVYWSIGRHRLVPDERINISEDYTLQINELSIEDSGAYTCHAKNKYTSSKDTRVVMVKECFSKLPMTNLKGQNFYFSFTAMNWDDATTFCENACMKLISLQNSEKNALIVNHLKYPATGWNFPTWTSGRKIGDKWRWTGINEDLTFTSWDVHQPDNAGLDALGPQRCLQLFSHNKMWDDLACAHKLRFICE